ncbi:MAG: TerB family tellurite resistance protein [Myxococcales bacterium]|nr:TerB family tellurite resistance protein [Myxococcales bacterium]
MEPEKVQRKVVLYELGFGTFIFSVIGCVLGLIFLIVGDDGINFFLNCCGIGSLVGMGIDGVRLKYLGSSFRLFPAAEAHSEPDLFEDKIHEPGDFGERTAPPKAEVRSSASNSPPRSARAAAMGADDGFHDIPTPIPSRPQPQQQQQYQYQYAPPPPRSPPRSASSTGAAASSAAAWRQQTHQEKRRRFAACFARAFIFVGRADGVTRPSEMAVVDRFFTQKLGFRASDEPLLDSVLTEVERNPGTIDALCADIRRELNRGEILTLFNGLYDIATVDGDLAKSEIAIIAQLASRLGVTDAELRQIRALFVPEAPQHYALLGLMPEASVSEIKSAFHRAVLENHPDRVSHLGEQAARMATQRFIEVQKAYDAIRQERGF